MKRGRPSPEEEEEEVVSMEVDLSLSPIQLEERRRGAVVVPYVAPWQCPPAAFFEPEKQDLWVAYRKSILYPAVKTLKGLLAVAVTREELDYLFIYAYTLYQYVAPTIQDLMKRWGNLKRNMSELAGVLRRWIERSPLEIDGFTIKEHTEVFLLYVVDQLN